MMRPAGFDLSFADATMQKGVKLIRRHVKAIRKLLYKGMVKYGKRIAEREFLLRRITRLSLDLYIVLAMLAWINARQRQGGDVADETRLLDYFIQEAWSNYRHNNRLDGGRKEKLHRRIFQDMTS